MAAFLALLAGGCGASLLYGGWQESATRDAFDEIVAASPSMTAEADAALGRLVAARRTEEGEVIPGFEILFSPIVFKDYSWISDKPAGYETGGPPYVSIPWNQAYEFKSSIEAQLVLRRPPRGSASLAAGDTFVIFKLSIDTYAGQNAGQDPADNIDVFSDMTLYGVWFDGRTVLDPLGPRSGWRPYLQYGGGIVEYPGHVDRDDLPNWGWSRVFGWHMAFGLEWRAAKLGAYVQYGVEAIGAPSLRDNVVPILNRAQEFVTYPLRVGFMLAF